jgi:hypothetical protein
MLQKVHSSVGVAAGVIGFGFLVAAAILPDGYGKYVALGAWVILDVVALLAFRRARSRAASHRSGWSLRDAHLIALGAAALVIAAVFGSALDGSIAWGALLVFGGVVTSWVYLPRMRARRAAGRV